MQLVKTNSKKFKRRRAQAIFTFDVTVDVLSVIFFSYASLYIAGALPATGVAKTALVAYLSVAAVVKLVCSAARNRVLE